MIDRFDSAAILEKTLSRYLRLYNHHLPQRALGHISPDQALHDWQEERPGGLKTKVYNLAGPDTETESGYHDLPCPHPILTGALVGAPRP